MASALIGGLMAQERPPPTLTWSGPLLTRAPLSSFGITAHAEAGAFLASANLLVWAVKPQTFKAAAAVRHNHNALAPERGSRHCQRQHCTLADKRAGGTRHAQHTGSHWQGHHRPVCKGSTVTESDKALVNQAITTTGEFLWLDAEAQLDAVTALSGSETPRTCFTSLKP